jgi:hypothetical protein
MKVNRQKINEEYNTTVGWVNDFANNLQKNADYLSNLRSIMNKREAFATIEEKMADLKDRAGFDLVKNIKTKEKQNIKSAKCGPTCCSEEAGKGKCGSCAEKHGRENQLIQTLNGILKYIEDFASDRPDISYGTVMSHCREHPKLGFDRVEGKIDHRKFKSLVEKILNKHKNDPEEVEYISEADVPSSYSDDIADYMAHASG